MTPPHVAPKRPPRELQPYTTTIELPIRPSRPLPSQTPTPSQSAAHQVFHLPELLETILLHLSQKDILLSQRTSCGFRHTITGSLRLQKALFFAPDWNLEGRTFNAYAKNNRPGRKPENNRLLLRAFPGCYPTVTLVITNDNTPTAQDLITGRAGSEHWSWDVCISFPADQPPNTSPAVLYPEASWRRMFLSQPPCTSLHLVRRWQRSLHPAIVREGGIKMGEFVDSATKTSGEWHSSYISSDRDWHFEGNIKCSRVMEDGDL